MRIYRKHLRNLLLEIGLATLVIATFGIGAVSAQSNKQIAESVAKWDKKYGYTLTGVSNAFDGISKDTSNSALLTACTKIFDAATTAEGKPAIPDKAAEKPWASALNSFVNGAEKCQYGLTNNNVNEIKQATKDFSQGNASLVSANKAILKLK